MKRKLNFYIAILAMALFSSSSQANIGNKSDEGSIFNEYFTIEKVELTEISDEAEEISVFNPLAIEGDCSNMKDSPPFSTLAGEELVIGELVDEVIAVGQKIWTIIENNKPVVNVNTNVAHALPRGVRCWTDLESWQAPQSRTYQISYKNLWGITVVDFKFRVLFSYGGKINGKGQYIANATIVPAGLNVLWGYTFNANLQVGQVLNLGTHDNPVAGMELGLNWQIKTPIQDNQHTANFFTQGNGIIKQLE